MLPIVLGTTTQDRLLRAQGRSRLQGGDLIPMPRPGWPSPKLSQSPKAADLNPIYWQRHNCRDPSPFLDLCAPRGLHPFPQPPKPLSLSALQFSQAPTLCSACCSPDFLLNLQPGQHFSGLRFPQTNVSRKTQDRQRARLGHLPPGEPPVALTRAEGLCPLLLEGMGSFPHL